MGIYGGVVQSANYRERKLETTIDALPPSSRTRPIYGSSDRTAYHTTVHVVHVSNNPYLMELRGAGGRPRLDTGKLGSSPVELSSPAGVTDMLARAALGLLNTSRTSAPGPARDSRSIRTARSPPAWMVKPRAPRASSVRDPTRGTAGADSVLAAVGRSPAAFVPQVRQAVAELLRRAFLPVDHWRPLHHR